MTTLKIRWLRALERPDHGPDCLTAADLGVAYTILGITPADGSPWWTQQHVLVARARCSDRHLRRSVKRLAAHHMIVTERNRSRNETAYALVDPTLWRTHTRGAIDSCKRCSQAGVEPRPRAVGPIAPATESGASATESGASATESGASATESGASATESGAIEGTRAVPPLPPTAPPPPSQEEEGVDNSEASGERTVELAQRLLGGVDLNHDAREQITLRAGHGWSPAQILSCLLDPPQQLTNPSGFVFARLHRRALPPDQVGRPPPQLARLAEPRDGWLVPVADPDRLPELTGTCDQCEGTTATVGPAGEEWCLEHTPHPDSEEA